MHCIRQFSSSRATLAKRSKDEAPTAERLVEIPNDIGYIGEIKSRHVVLTLRNDNPSDSKGNERGPTIMESSSIMETVGYSKMGNLGYEQNTVRHVIKIFLTF